jgi:hypothetical protein
MELLVVLGMFGCFSRVFSVGMHWVDENRLWAVMRRLVGKYGLGSTGHWLHQDIEMLIVVTTMEI